MQLQVIDKLNKFIEKRSSIKEESEVVYLLVELRKLLDRAKAKNDKSYSLVRFHADWIVHISKDNITPVMKKIMMEVDNLLNPLPKNGNIDFLLMPEFRTELTNLLDEFGISNNFCKNDNSWLSFVVALTQVLSDQPMVNPTENIAEFRYIDLKKEGVMANIDFKDNKAGGSITLGFGL